MKVFQYWDTGEPPEDVAACIQSVRDLNPRFDHWFFDHARAARFIGDFVGHREAAAFASLAIPAMQADYFRLCALTAKGGWWIDADDLCRQPIRTLLRENPAAGAYASMRDNLLTNPVLFARTPGNPFFSACLELATRRIEARTEGRATDVTGGLVLNLVWAAADAEGAHEDPHRARDPAFETTEEARAVVSRHPGIETALSVLERRHQLWTEQALIGVRELSYKSTSRDWRHWPSEVYLDATCTPAPAGADHDRDGRGS